MAGASIWEKALRFASGANNGRDADFVPGLANETIWLTVRINKEVGRSRAPRRPARASTKESRPMDLKKIASDLASVLLVGLFIVAADPSPLLAEDAAAARTVAFLGVQLQNDNEGLETTTDAERARMKEIERLFESKLDGSGRFKFVPVPPETMKEIAAGQNIGDCHGCEVEYGRKLHADLIAWIKVQKVSNLILNMNVYMADVVSEKMTFVHSVDIRGNTDESWTRSLNYLLDNYFLKSGS